MALLSPEAFDNNICNATIYGLGLELARELLLRDFYVVACRKNPEETQVEEMMALFPDHMAILPLDIGDDKSVAALENQVAALVPHLDLLVNNAGILGDMQKILGDDLDYTEMLQVLNVNAVGTLRVTNALCGLVMKSTLKMIVNISSEAGSIQDCFRQGWFGYCMSKSANNMQSALVHNNIKKDGGRVVVIHPGHVATYMRGHLDTTARITATESAKSILKVVLDKPLPVEERPLYLDYRGVRLPW